MSLIDPKRFRMGRARDDLAMAELQQAVRALVPLVQGRLTQQSLRQVGERGRPVETVLVASELGVPGRLTYDFDAGTVGVEEE